MRIALKVPAPSMAVAYEWGDYHLALSLQKALAKRGHCVRVDLLPQWDDSHTPDDDVVFVLRGLSIYQPRSTHINIMWNISHPDRVSLAEYNLYDHVFVASKQYCDFLEEKVRTPVSPLLEFTDPEIYYSEIIDVIPSEDLLFVGNSRKQYREVVRFAIEEQLPISVYGTRWEGIIPAQYIKGYIQNDVLRHYFSKCKILLNDHWPTMRQYGFICKRVFDAAACGTFFISDRTPVLDDLFDGLAVTYASKEDLKDSVQYFLAHPENRGAIARSIQQAVLQQHTVDHRVEIILDAAERIRENRLPRGASVFSPVRLPVVAGVSLPVEPEGPLTNPSVRIYQTVLTEEDRRRIEPGFVPFDNIGNERPDWYEYWVFKMLFENGLHERATYTGLVSCKFRQKARITGEEFIRFVATNPGYDVYFVDPYQYNADAYPNVWAQGEVWHAGLMEIAQRILDKLGYGVQLRKLVNTSATSAYCNYWAGNARFWQEYMRYTRPIFEYIETQANDEEKEMLNRSVYKSKAGITYKPFIMERMFSTLLAVRPDLKANKYPVSLEQKYAALLEDYRSLSRGYGRLYDKVNSAGAGGKRAES